MSHTSFPGGHNPSPYLRRYRLPQLGNGPSSYEELLSPIDDCSKMAFISALNFQKKHFQLSAPMLRRPIGNPPAAPTAVTTTTATTTTTPAAITPTSCSNEDIASTSQRNNADECAMNSDIKNSVSKTNPERKCLLLNFDVRLEIAQLEQRSSRLVEECSRGVAPTDSEQMIYNENLRSSTSF